MRWLPSHQVERIAVRALQNGGRLVGPGTRHVEWDLAPRCQKPNTVEICGRPVFKTNAPKVLPKEGKHMTVTLHTKCRRCEPCLALRSASWRMRIKGELSVSPRTWFGTLTLSPQSHAHALAVARLSLSKQGVDYDALTREDQFLEHHKVVAKELTLYLKRIRKAGKPFRYILVAEAHDGGGQADGLPHYHLLLHEKSIAGALRKRMLQEQWHLGFSQFKLVTELEHATYLCKYLSKSLLARVRASQCYGKIH